MLKSRVIARSIISIYGPTCILRFLTNSSRTESSMAGTQNQSASATPVSPAPVGAHRNRLTECFDDIMKVAAEMMVQQQLKTVQLDSSVVNGFSQAQQRVLSEKIHMFHAILDDLQTTLTKSKSYVGTIHEIALEKQKVKEKERADLRKRQEEEEQRKNKEQEEKARREEMEKKADGQRQQQSRPDTGLGFPLETGGGILPEFSAASRDFGGSPSLPISVDQSAAATTPRPIPDSQPSPQSELQQSRASDLGGMSNMDISMFPGLESSGFDMGNFNNGTNGTSRPVESTETTERNGEPNTNEEPGALSMGDNGEDYLTLNDFNDMNIDWSAGGDSGDLDLNGFNI